MFFSKKFFGLRCNVSPFTRREVFLCSGYKTCFMLREVPLLESFLQCVLRDHETQALLRVGEQYTAVQVQVLYVVLHAPATASTLLVSYLGSRLLNSALKRYHRDVCPKIIVFQFVKTLCGRSDSNSRTLTVFP